MSARRITGFALAAGGLLGLGACGAPAERSNDERPPAPINVTAALIDGHLQVSPRSFGAGPIRLLVTNQTKDARTITLQTDETGGSEPGLRRKTGPISPAGTATLAVDVREGDYRLSANGGDIDAVALKVGPARPSAQGDLSLP
jgi:hypothetical protein